MQNRPVCRACRTCPHGEVWPKDSTVCVECLLDYYTAWTFTGPVIKNREKYYVESMAWCGTWSSRTFNDTNLMFILIKRCHRKAPVTPSFPWPLIHHLEKTSPATWSAE